MKTSDAGKRLFVKDPLGSRFILRGFARLANKPVNRQRICEGALGVEPPLLHAKDRVAAHLGFIGAVELIVGKRAHLRYSTIENWSKNMYNLNTKRARVDEDGEIEWISGSFGSHVGYLYPMSVLNGARARSSFTGITFAGAGQNLDTGCKVVLNAPDTTASVETKGISKSGGVQTFRSSIVATPKAEGSKATVSCQSLMLDDQSRSDTIPAMDIRAKNVDIGHEATIGRIGDDKVFYLMSRGISEEEARTMIVNGFANPVSKELPLEYAVEMNNLIKLEMEGAIG